MQFDSQGFLIVDKPTKLGDLGNELTGIHADTSAILDILKSGVRTGRGPRGQRAPASDVPRANSVIARTRDARGRFVAVGGASAIVPATAVAPVAKAVQTLTRQQAEQHAEVKREEAARRSREGSAPVNGRDARGRFVGGGGRSGGSGPGDLSWFRRTFAKLRHGFGAAEGKLAAAVNVGEIEKVDPAIEAAKEAARVVKGPAGLVASVGKAVLGRGFGFAKDKSSSWLGRIWFELRFTRRQQSAFDTAQLRTLKSIDKRTGQGRGGGLFSSLLSGIRLPGLGMGGILGGLFGLIGKVGKLGWRGLTKLLPGLAKGGMKFLGPVGKLLRRIPGLGALMAGGSAVMSLFGHDDPSKSPEQNRRDKFVGIGRGLGGVLGAIVGEIFGPIGGVLGAMMGDKLGKLVGNWLADVDWTKVAKSITDMWDTCVKTLGTAWDDLVKSAKDWFKDKLGIDVEKVQETAKTVLKDSVEVVKDWGGKVGAWGAGLVEAGRMKFDKGYRGKADWSGIKGGEGLAMGTYTGDEAERIRQLKASGANTDASLKGGMPREIQQKIVNQALAAGLNPVEMLKIAAMESGGNSNAVSPTGAIGIYQFVGRTASGVGIKDRFDADQNIAGGMSLAQENAKRLRAANLPATSENLYLMHQLGPGAIEVIKGAQQGKSISDLSPDIQKAISLNYGGNKAKTAAEYIDLNRKALDDRFKSTVAGSAGGFIGIPDKAVAQNKTASTATSAPAIGSMPTIGVASMPPLRQPVFSMPTAVAPPPVAQASFQMPLSPSYPMQVVLADNRLIGQDVSDRRMAHIASGGISG
ncbi:transglycosylase SLT domain-containing protein [Paraburkholderia sp. J10-1]|uniref:transglycosylase SLT domain-containing protein n=1 Tax=Paraburkholderia sp. J10-1 TaxID=2805430 RepID=UPI002AB702A2|nr:transglycosylase SLT domain-containing protein [Paraburkholderia sp. J10-1]